MDSWERFDETVRPNRKEFSSNLEIENITDIDFRHAQRVFKDFNNKKLSDYRYVYGSKW